MVPDMGDVQTSRTRREPLLGTHVLVDLWGVDRDLLDDAEGMRALLVEAAVAGGATVKGVRMERFQPHGVSGVVILAESHLAIHTWPEHGAAAADVFTCGAPEVARAVADELIGSLAPARHQQQEVERGAMAPVLEVAG